METMFAVGMAAGPPVGEAIYEVLLNPAPSFFISSLNPP